MGEAAVDLIGFFTYDVPMSAAFVDPATGLDLEFAGEIPFIGTLSRPTSRRRASPSTWSDRAERLRFAAPSRPKGVGAVRMALIGSHRPPRPQRAILAETAPREWEPSRPKGVGAVRMALIGSHRPPRPQRAILAETAPREWEPSRPKGVGAVRMAIIGSHVPSGPQRSILAGTACRGKQVRSRRRAAVRRSPARPRRSRARRSGGRCSRPDRAEPRSSPPPAARW